MRVPSSYRGCDLFDEDGRRSHVPVEWYEEALRTMRCMDQILAERAVIGRVVSSRLEAHEGWESTAEAIRVKLEEYKRGME